MDNNCVSEIKANPALKGTTAAILTTLRVEEDILKSHDVGLKSFIVKPLAFQSLFEAVHTVGE